MLDIHQDAFPPSVLLIPQPGNLDAGHVGPHRGSGPEAQRRRQLEKAEAFGQLAGGLVHDFNNLLNVIVGNLDRARRQLPADTVASRCVADATTATDRAAALVRRLLAFIRQQPLLPEVVDVDTLLLELRPLIELATPGCATTFDLACGWRCLVDVSQFRTALLNLAANARDAMPGGGRLTVTTRTLEHRTDGGDGFIPRDSVMLEVRDFGVGMSPEVRERACEPLFTTKAEGRGTGLGLSQVAALVLDCGGTMRIASQVGEGTSVTLVIPRAPLLD